MSPTSKFCPQHHCHRVFQRTKNEILYSDPNIDVTWSDCAHLIPADKNFVGGGGGNGVSDLFFRFFFDFIFEVSIFGFNGESDSESDEDELLWLLNFESLEKLELRIHLWLLLPIKITSGSKICPATKI